MGFGGQLVYLTRVGLPGARQTHDDAIEGRTTTVMRSTAWRAQFRAERLAAGAATASTPFPTANVAETMSDDGFHTRIST